MQLTIRRSILLFFSGVYACSIFPFAEGYQCKEGGIIDDEWKCDYMVDCPDGSDEFPETCADRSCSDDQFRCNNTRCIDKSYACDGEPDCQDGDSSDEEGCDKPMSPDGDSCKQFKCSTTEDCFPFVWVCDGERDCSDGSDEANCVCIPGDYGCYSRGVSLCFQNSTKCDGVEHCDDGSDEQDCSGIEYTGDDSFSCPSTKYKCRTKNQCVLWKLVCDGIPDCSDESDEGGLCHANDCGNRKTTGINKPSKPKVVCEQYCRETPDGAKCTCDAGFRLADDGTHCLDVNECKEMSSKQIHNAEKLSKLYKYGLRSVCSQKCVNLVGGFHCACADGYELDADGYTCKAMGTFSPELYIGVNNEIRIFSLRGPGDSTFQYSTMYKSTDSDETILGIDVFVTTLSVVWIEKKSARLMMMSGPVVGQINVDFRPVAVSVDWVNFNIFVTSSSSGNHAWKSPAVNLIALTNEMFVKAKNNIVDPDFKRLITDGLKEPVAIALCPSKGIMVVADAGDANGNGRRIFLANMDGSNIRNIVTNNLLPPTDVIIDDVQNAVIWSSYNKEISEAKIETITLDGTQRGTILSRKLNRFPLEPVSIDFFEGRLYISDKQSKEVRSWNVGEISLYGRENTMYDSKGVVKLEHKMRLGAIKIAHPVLQRPTTGGSLCMSAGCSQLCVVTFIETNKLIDDENLKAKCFCSEGYQLSKNFKNCSRGQADSSRSPLSSTVLKSVTPPTMGVFIPKSNTEISIIKTPSETKVTCRSPGPFYNAISVPEELPSHRKLPVGTLVRISCLAGYFMQNDYGVSRKTKDHIECLGTGKWSAPPPKCVVMTELPVHRESMMKTPHISTVLDRLTSGMKSMINSAKKSGTSKTTLCISLNCGPWGKCVLNDNEEYECRCKYGESSSNIARCLPPKNYVIAKNTTVLQNNTNPASSSTSNSKLMIALIIVAVILFFVLVFLSWRCLRKKRYSVDLRYFRGGTPQRSPISTKDDVVVEVSVDGRKPTSITNPNYSSPSQRKKLPKPVYYDDGSDSGIQQSLAGSESVSSTTSENSACEGSSKSCKEETHNPTNISPLLDDEIYEDEVAMGDVSIGSLSRSGKVGLGGRLGRLFKMRKTESRECMLPKRNHCSRIRFTSDSNAP
ncbi:vitellogenin receptor Yl-like isoform X1 [Styela clava]